MHKGDQLTELSGEPAYRQVASDLRRQIRGGKLPAGSQLPSLSQLMTTYNASSTVIKAAINELRTDGLVVGQQGKGIFVREPNAEPDEKSASAEVRALMNEIKALRDEVRQVNERIAAVEEQARAAHPRSGR